MKANATRNPIILWALSLSSVLLLAGFLPVRWPFEIPGAVAGRLWLSNVFEPVLRALSSPGTAFHGATLSSVAWWPFVLGIALLLPVLGVIGRSDRPRRTWGFPISLAMCLGGLRAVNVVYASNPSNSLLILGIGLGLGAGISLAGIGRNVIEGSPIALSNRLAQSIRILLIIAGIGIGSFVLLPFGSIALALAVAAIAIAYAQAALASRRMDRLSESGQPNTTG